jgi:hypothetical protein
LPEIDAIGSLPIYFWILGQVVAVSVLIWVNIVSFVIRGLDPRIHQSSKEIFTKRDGLPGQARQ